MKIVTWYKRSFANQIIFLNLSIGFLMAILIGTISLVLSYQVVKDQEDNLIYKDLLIARDRVERELSLVIKELRTLSQNSDLVNGLADPLRRNIHIAPLLNSSEFEHLSFYRTSVWDYKGSILLQKNPDFDGPSAQKIKSWLLLNGEKNSLNTPDFSLRAIVFSQDENIFLIIAAPIFFPSSNDPQGFLTAELILSDLVGRWLAPESDPGELTLLSGQFIHDLNYFVPLRLDDPLKTLDFSLHFKPAQSSAVSALKLLLPSFLALTLFGLIVSALFSNAAGKKIANPILYLAEKVRLIGEAGRVEPKLLADIKVIPNANFQDEIAQLKLDVHNMFQSLYVLQNDLEAQVQTRNEKLKTIFDLSPDGYLEIDRAGKVSFFNEPFAKMMRITGLQIGKTLWSDLEKSLNNRLANGELFFNSNTFKDRVIRFNTPLLSTIFVMKRVTNDGNQIYYWRDLTRDAEIEVMKKAFFAKVTHEIRTPIANILGFTEFLLNNPKLELMQKEGLETIMRHGKNLLVLVNDLLTLSKSESESLSALPKQYQSLAALTRLILKDFKIEGDARNFVLLLDDHLPEVLIDASKYRQVLLNLLSNAHKYSERGTPIEISTRQESWDGRVWIVLQVKDFGIGMTELELSRIGQPFFRANQNDSIGGTGLGISVVKEIVEFHQGRLTFASKPNVGTIATVWFPVESLALKK